MNRSEVILEFSILTIGTIIILLWWSDGADAFNIRNNASLGPYISGVQWFNSCGNGSTTSGSRILNRARASTLQKCFLCDLTPAGTTSGYGSRASWTGQDDPEGWLANIDAAWADHLRSGSATFGAKGGYRPILTHGTKSVVPELSWDYIRLALNFKMKSDELSQAE